MNILSTILASYGGAHGDSFHRFVILHGFGALFVALALYFAVRSFLRWRAFEREVPSGQLLDRVDQPIVCRGVPEQSEGRGADEHVIWIERAYQRSIPVDPQTGKEGWRTEERHVDTYDFVLRRADGARLRVRNEDPEVGGVEVEVVPDRGASAETRRRRTSIRRLDVSEPLTVAGRLTLDRAEPVIERDPDLGLILSRRDPADLGRKHLRQSLWLGLGCPLSWLLCGLLGYGIHYAWFGLL